MQINFDDKCSSSEKIAKNLIEEALDFLDKSKTKRKDCVRETLKKHDESLLVIFDKMIERKAILARSERINGRIRTMLQSAPRNLVFYSIKKMIDIVPSEEEMKTAFMEAWINGKSPAPSNCAKFGYLKTEKDPFSLFMNLPFGDFYILASYCFCEYDRIKQKKEKEDLEAKKAKEKTPKADSNAKKDVASCEKKNVIETSPTKNVEEQKPCIIPKQPEKDVSIPTEGVMETILDNMSKFNKSASEKENKYDAIDENSAFSKYRDKREKMRNSVADKIDAIHKLTDVNAYLKYSFIELKRVLDPALFRGNQYANLKYSNNEVFECGFDNTNVLMTKISFDVSSLEKIKDIVDNALEVKKVFEDAKNSFEDGMTKEELEIVKTLAK